MILFSSRFRQEHQKGRIEKLQEAIQEIESTYQEAILGVKEEAKEFAHTRKSDLESNIQGILKDRWFSEAEKNKEIAKEQKRYYIEVDEDEQYYRCYERKVLRSRNDFLDILRTEAQEDGIDIQVVNALIEANTSSAEILNFPERWKQGGRRCNMTPATVYKLSEYIKARNSEMGVPRSKEEGI